MILIVRNNETGRITAFDLSKANYLSITKSNELRICFDIDEPDIGIKLPEMNEEKRFALLIYLGTMQNKNTVEWLDRILKTLGVDVDEKKAEEKQN